eukprot:scaffold1_cov375-Pavlova_lutheri.AAC.44
MLEGRDPTEAGSGARRGPLLARLCYNTKRRRSIGSVLDLRSKRLVGVGVESCTVSKVAQTHVPTDFFACQALCVPIG